MVVATGFFDGVHLGHRAVLGALVRAARERGEESLVATFWPHPRTVLQQEASELRLLTTTEEKQALLRSLGVDRVEVLPFTRAFSRLTAREYLEQVILGRFGARSLLLGYDNRLGSDLLPPSAVEALAREMGLEVIRAPRIDWASSGAGAPVTEAASAGPPPSGPDAAGISVIEAGAAISSTRIRRALEAGDAEAAAAMLGYRYSLLGVVVAGNRLGRTIGFPTANMQLYEPLKLIPGNGAYEVEVETVGVKRRGMCNIGVRPTVGNGNARTIETHIFDFDQDIYGLDIRVTFLRKIRDEVRFAGLDELRLQLKADRRACLG